jgi:glycyl-tRNA synthetase
LLEDVTVPSATRADYAIVRNNAGNYNAVEMKAAFERFQIVSPDTGNPLCDPFPYNLMFASSIGPTGKVPGFLRPETAQGIFTNFRRLLEANNNRMPFAAAQIGLAFRNEIAPRSGLLRVREFQMAEIEHFVNPNDKQHPRFQEVADVELNLFSRDLQGGAEENTIHMTVGDAVAKGVIDNQTLGYYLARTHLFLVKVGINPAKLRFRQHKSNEMAHYAKDCWDAEIHTSYGWVECVGHADRACYDLVQHAKASNVELCAHETFAEPRIEEVARFNFNRGAIAKQFRKDQQRICDHLQALPKADALAVKAELESVGTHTINFCTGESFTVTAEQVKIAIVQEKISSRKYVPSVIEPSFGIGRILYALIEHAFWTRPDDVQKKVLAFSPFIAPTKCSVFPLSGNPEFAPYTRQVSRLLLDAGISSRVDESGSSLGRRYGSP